MPDDQTCPLCGNPYMTAWTRHDLVACSTKWKGNICIDNTGVYSENEPIVFAHD